MTRLELAQYMWDEFVVKDCQREPGLVVKVVPPERPRFTSEIFTADGRSQYMHGGFAVKLREAE